MSKHIQFTNGVLSARYDSTLHGERTINVINPEWIRPTHDVTVQPGELFEYNGGSEFNDTGAPQVVKDVLDLDAVPDYISVDNPDCKIPAEALEVSDEVFYQTINETDGIWSLVDGEVIKLPFPAPTISDLKQSKRRGINAAFEKSMQQITNGYPANEVSSWAKQESEARAYIANHLAHTPLIDALASSRSVDKADLVGRIIAKADLFADISGTLIGRRQALEDTLDALPETATADDVAAIVWL